MELFENCCFGSSHANFDWIVYLHISEYFDSLLPILAVIINFFKNFLNKQLLSFAHQLKRCL